VAEISIQELTRAMKERIWLVIAEVSEEMGIKIENGVISSDHLHLFVVIPPHTLDVQALNAAVFIAQCKHVCQEYAFLCYKCALMINFLCSNTALIVSSICFNQHCTMCIFYFNSILQSKLYFAKVT
jgi:hypothetical protein